MAINRQYTLGNIYMYMQTGFLSHRLKEPHFTYGRTLALDPTFSSSWRPSECRKWIRSGIVFRIVCLGCLGAVGPKYNILMNWYDFGRREQAHGAVQGRPVSFVLRELCSRIDSWIKLGLQCMCIAYIVYNACIECYLYTVYTMCTLFVYNAGSIEHT